jgi:Cys-tRNA(Pro)/Cys-tRNA(Cys) deacylase
LAAKERNCKLSQIIKTMVGKDDEGNYHVCLLPGDKTLKLKKVRKEAGGKKINLMTPEEIETELNLMVGAIAPFLFPENTAFYIDPSVLEEEYIDISSAHPLAGVEIQSKDLLAVVKGKVCDIVSSNS